MKDNHPLWLRCTHWLNVPVLAILVWSGVMIYWANAAYPLFFPEWFFDFFHLNGRLAEAMAIHFAIAWIFVLNGSVYLFGFFSSGHWREVLPTRDTFRDLIPTILHDLGLRKEAPLHGKFNAAQRLAYTGAVFLGALAILSGFAVYKPVQLGFLRGLFLGYEGARLAHFLAMLGLVGFTMMHVIQVARAGFGKFRTMVGRTNFSLALLAGFFLLLGGLWTVVTHESEEEAIPTALRAVHEWNGNLWSRIYSPSRSAACVSPKNGVMIRENGNLGLETPLDSTRWRLEISSEGKTSRLFSMDFIRALPRVRAEIEFRCIEGWSSPLSYAGARFSDFMKSIGVNSADYRFVGLATPDGGYYVSVDMESMLHPETVLAYEMNDAAISPEHGAPLRLVIPVKYGIKSLKRIGKIFFSNSRPPDYWAEQGYDWHSGL